MALLDSATIDVCSKINKSESPMTVVSGKRPSCMTGTMTAEEWNPSNTKKDKLLLQQKHKHKPTKLKHRKKLKKKQNPMLNSWQ